MSKHTPGPWFPVFNGLFIDIKLKDGEYEQSFASIHTNGTLGIDADRRDANARLIAAAPEMLAMLKFAQIFMSLDGRFDMQGIDAVIAKAEGLADG